MQKKNKLFFIAISRRKPLKKTSFHIENSYEVMDVGTFVNCPKQKYYRDESVTIMINSYTIWCVRVYNNIFVRDVAYKDANLKKNISRSNAVLKKVKNFFFRKFIPRRPFRQNNPQHYVKQTATHNTNEASL